MTKDEAMEMALEALENMNPYPASKEYLRNDAIAALRQALEQPAQAKFFYGQDPNVLPPFNKGKIHE